MTIFPRLLSILVFLLLYTSEVAGYSGIIFQAEDLPDDDGTAIVLTWEGRISPEDSVIILRSIGEGGEWSVIDTVEARLGEYIDRGVRRGESYRYLLRWGEVSVSTQPVVAKASLIHKARINQLVILAVFFAFVLIYIRLAARGKRFFVRRIPGLKAIEEAIGRATEMGRAVLYVPGIDDMNNIQTIASMVILSDVARLAATYETPLIVPVCRPFVVPVAEETVRQGFLNAGRPELYNADNIRYLSDEQFAFTAGVNGIMLRERTAANLYMGSFFAESLILAETGFSTGAIQVAGTANIHQLPFFVAACDYTLIGEELYAASAYLSHEPKLIGTLKASDLAKVLIIIILIIGVITQTLGLEGFSNWFTAR